MKQIFLPSGTNWFRQETFTFGKSQIADNFAPLSLFVNLDFENVDMYIDLHFAEILRRLKASKTSKQEKLTDEIEKDRDLLTYALFKKIERREPDAHLALLLEAPKVIPTRFQRVYKKLIIKHPYKGINWASLFSECFSDGCDVEIKAIHERRQTLEKEIVTFWTTTDLSELSEEDKIFILSYFPRKAA